MTIQGDIPQIATQWNKTKPGKKVRFYLPEDCNMKEGSTVLATATREEEKFQNQTVIIGNQDDRKFVEIPNNGTQKPLSQINICKISTTKAEEELQAVEEYIANPGKLGKNIKLKIDKDLQTEKQDEIAPFFAENDLTEKMQTTVAEFDEDIPFTIKKYAINDIQLNHLPPHWQGDTKSY